MSDKIYYPETIKSYALPDILLEESTELQNYIGKVDIEPVSLSQAVGFPINKTANELINIALNTQTKRILGEFKFGEIGALQIGTYENGSTGDIRISPSGIVGRNSDGDTTFSIDGTTGDATFIGTISAGSVITGAIYSTSDSGARVLIFPDANTGIQIIDNASSDVFKAIIGGTDVGDVIIGNYSGGAGAKWDKSAGDFLIKGDMEAGTITGVTISGGSITGSTIKTKSTGARVQLDANDAKILLYDGGEDLVFTLDDDGSGVRLISSDGRDLTVDSDDTLTLSADGIISLDAGGSISYDVATAQIHAFYVNSVEKLNISSGSVQLSTALDMDGNDANNMDVIDFNARSSDPSNDWCVYAYSSGGTYQLRVRLNGSTYSANLTPE